MKKILTGVIVFAAVLSFTACNNCGDSSCDTAKNDTISAAYGDYVGSMLLTDFSNMGKNNKTDKQEFLRGMQVVLGADTAQNNLMGMQVALQLTRELQQLELQGVKLDRNLVVKAFKQRFLTDSISFMETQEASGRFRELYMAAVEEAKAAKEAEKEQEPEAIQNVKAGENFVADQKAANPAIKTTENGLSYLIEAEGTGDHPSETSTVEVNYTGKLINGTVFDTTDGRGPATFPLQGVVPGFREGLMLLGKGGKATLYIPGKLAYGVNGQPSAGIGPNEMLIFEVELLNIK